MGLSNFTPNNNSSNSTTPPTNASISIPAGLFNPSDITTQSDNGMLVNYNEKFKDSSPALFRDKIITQTIGVVISYRKPNALLTGSAGVGKTAIVEELARRIANNDASIPPQLAKTTIYELPLANLVAGASMAGELEERITDIIAFAEDPDNDAILFIDEIHQILDSRDPMYSKVSQVLKPALARGDLRVIAATTTTEAKRLDNDPAFKRRFSSIIVDELTSQQTREILSLATPALTQHHNNAVSVSDEVLDHVVATADRLMVTGHRPDTALTLLDRALGDVIASHNEAIQKAHAAGDTTLAQQLSQLSPVPLTTSRLSTIALRLITGQAQPVELDINQLTTELARLKGQEDTLPPVIDALRRKQLGIFPQVRPTSWLFAGASGVGKSESARIISHAVTGQEPILLNMAEFHSSASINRIIGSPSGYIGSDSAMERPFDILASNPHRVIVLDEFEKADISVQRLFLSALDTGEIQMANGGTIDVSRCIIIATTNAAKRQTSTTGGISLGGNQQSFTKRSLVNELQQFFDAELLGRFDDIIGFQPLNVHLYAEIIKEEYQRQIDRICTENPALSFEPISEETVTELVQKTWLPDQGARPAVRAVRAHIENLLL